MVGKTISHYRILSQLGAGGMGIVYAAEDHRLGRSVALKFVPDDLDEDDEILERLRSEARTASALNHANICTIYDIDEYEGRPFIVMELLKGQTLRERLVPGPLKVHEIVDIGIQVADALDSAHANNIIHRDIKPANLFLVDRGQIKIVDFGLAKLLPRQPAAGTTGGATTDLTVAGTTLGTVAYMSPEQVTGEDLDCRTDLFSLGVVLYEAATGRQPFTGKTSAVVLSAILNQTPVPPIVFNPEIPLRLQEVISNCLEKDRELRYQNAGGLRADLRRVKRDLESGHSRVMGASGGFDALTSSTVNATSGWLTGAKPESTPSRIQNPESAGGRNATLGIAVVAVVGLALAGTAGYLLWRRAPQATVAGIVSPPDTLILSRLESAAANLRAKNFRAALSQSEEVLQAAPDRADAIRIRDEARAIIARYDEAIARATTLLAAGDADAAKAAIDAARAIDPDAPAVNELSARLADQFNARGEAGRKGSPAQSPPARVTLPRPPASTDAARRDSQQPSPPADPPSQTPTSAPRTPPPEAPLSAPAPEAPVSPPPAAPSNSGNQAATPSPPAPSPSIAPPPPVQPEPSPPVREPVAPSDAPSARRETTTPPPANESDDTAIRRLVATYVRAIETKDLALFRSIKPNMSAEEQRRIEAGFRAVTSQRVAIMIQSINRRDTEASVRLQRSDTIEAGGRQQTVDTQQTMTLTRNGAAWIIREIGR